MRYALRVGAGTFMTRWRALGRPPPNPDGPSGVEFAKALLEWTGH